MTSDEFTLSSPDDENPLLSFVAESLRSGSGVEMRWKKSQTPAGRPWWVMERLSMAKQGWTTPTVFDASSNQPARLRPSRIATGRKTDYISRQVRMLHGDGVLNPEWVAQLMGVPDGWL